MRPKAIAMANFPIILRAMASISMSCGKGWKKEKTIWTVRLFKVLHACISVLSMWVWTARLEWGLDWPVKHHIHISEWDLQLDSVCTIRYYIWMWKMFLAASHRLFLNCWTQSNNPNSFASTCPYFVGFCKSINYFNIFGVKQSVLWCVNTV